MLKSVVARELTAQGLVGEPHVPLAPVPPKTVSVNGILGILRNLILETRRKHYRLV